MKLSACIDCTHFHEVKSTAFGWCKVKKEKRDWELVNGYSPACDRIDGK